MDGAERVDAAALVHSPMLSMSQDFRRGSIRGRRSHVLLRTRRRFPRFVSTLSSQVPRQVWQIVDGNPRLHEEYANIKADVPLDSALFDPKQWATVKHWTKP